MRLNPLYPEMGYMLSGLGWAHLVAGKYEEALAIGLKSLRELPTWMSSHRLIVVCLVQLGRLEEARVAAARIVELMPGVTIASLRPLFYQWSDRAFNDRCFSAFQLAGIPE